MSVMLQLSYGDKGSSRWLSGKAKSTYQEPNTTMSTSRKQNAEE